MAPGVATERSAPVCNAAVEDFVRDRHLNAHRRKVSRSRTLVNNSWTAEEEQKLQKPRRNPKRDQLQADRYSSIERENSRLMLRMNEIEHRGPARAAACAILGPAQPVAPVPAGRSSSLPPPGAGSNAGARARELRRIDAENLQLLRRLQSARPSVNGPRLDEGHRAQQRVMRMRCEHQRPEWKESLPPRPPSLAKLQPPSAQGSDGLDDAECNRLLLLQEQLSLKLAKVDAEAEAIAAAEAVGEPDSAGPGPSGVGPIDAPAAGEDGAAEQVGEAAVPFGGVIPAASRALADALLAGHGSEPRTAEPEDSEYAAMAAKEAAAAALRMAHAVDARSSDFLAYGDVIQRHHL